MNYKIILLLLLSNITIIFFVGENHFFANPQKEYFKIIEDAEFLYLNGDYPAAHKMYNRAFKLQYSHFLKDKYNYLALSCKIGVLENIKATIIELLENNVDFNFLKQKIPCLNDLKFELEPKIFTVRSLRDTIIKALEDDQTSRLNGYTLETEKIDSLNFILLKKIIIDYDFPSERDLMLNDSLPYLNAFHFLIWHQRSYEDRAIYLTNALSTAIIKGKIHPNIAGKLLWVLSNGQSPIEPDPIYKLGYTDSDDKEYLDQRTFKRLKTQEEIRVTDSIRAHYNIQSYNSQLECQLLSKNDTLFR